MARRRISLEGRLHDYHPDVGRLWRSRDEEPQQEVFNRLPVWMIPPHEDRDTKIDLERLFPAILETLTNREQKLLWCRYWADLTLEESGLVFGVTRERIRQIEAKAIRRLKHPSRSEVLRTLFEPCPVQERLNRQRAEEQSKWYAKWVEDRLIATMLELRETT